MSMPVLISADWLVASCTWPLRLVSGKQPAGKASATCAFLYSSNSQANQNSEASIHCSPAASPQPHKATAKCCNFLQRCSFPFCYLQDACGESPWKQNVCGWPRQNTFSLGWIYFKIKAQLVMGFYYYYYKYLFKAGYYHYGDFCLVFQHQGLNKRPHTQEGCGPSLIYSDILSQSSMLLSFWEFYSIII